MFKLFLILVLSSMSIVANAECSALGCDKVTVDQLYVEAGSGRAYIATSGDETKMSCQAVSGLSMTLDLTQPGGKTIYATLLTAQTTNKLVYIRADETSVGCKILYVTLNKQ